MMLFGLWLCGLFLLSGCICIHHLASSLSLSHAWLHSSSSTSVSTTPFGILRINQQQHRRQCRRQHQHLWLLQREQNSKKRNTLYRLAASTQKEEDQPTRPSSSSSSSTTTSTTSTSTTTTTSTSTGSNDNHATTTNTTNTLTIAPIQKLEGTVTLPGSKSLSNRCLLLAALSDGETHVQNLLDSDDIRYMLEALKVLQVPVQIHSPESVTVTGMAGPIPFPTTKTTQSNDNNHNNTVTLFLGNAGTAMRPLTAALCYGTTTGPSQERDEVFVLDGVPRMRERPIADLIDGLVQLDAAAHISCVSETGCPPVTIIRHHSSPPNHHSKKNGNQCRISGKMSSQFLSALLMAAPLSDDDTTITIKDELISAPYVALTIDLMKKFGVTVNIMEEGSMRMMESIESIKSTPTTPSPLIPTTPTFFISKDQFYKSPGGGGGYMWVEGDASSASYFLAGAAITAGGNVTVRGCGSASVQGDVAFAHVLEQMGAHVHWEADRITVASSSLTSGSRTLKGVDVDCGMIPDAAMTLAVVALFADGPTTIRNVYSWRLKETERMQAIVAECTKLGATVEEYRDYCVIHPPPNNILNNHVVIETYDDHRMAMAFSLVACGNVHVIINDPACTTKTFPTYFQMLESITIR